MPSTTDNYRDTRKRRPDMNTARKIATVALMAVTTLSLSFGITAPAHADAEGGPNPDDQCGGPPEASILWRPVCWSPVCCSPFTKPGFARCLQKWQRGVVPFKHQRKTRLTMVPMPSERFVARRRRERREAEMLG